MKKKVFFACLVLLLIFACQRKKERVIRPEGSFDISTPDLSDRNPNGGMLRFTLDGKRMHDKYFVAMFTPRGDLFEKDNLQLFNYNLGSDKYPQFIINVDHKESDLKKWQGIDLPLDFLAFTAAPNTVPLNSRGNIKILRVTENMIEGQFSGRLIHPVNRKEFEIKGEFKAKLQLNI